MVSYWTSGKTENGKRRANVESSESKTVSAILTEAVDIDENFR